ncbi:MAG: ParB/RepB/Spo0J family partition protein [Pseudomonadota bacterium]|nr:ParB/RepB/Spo0J family partition protein [Pseudomonadota bacterium]
MSTKSKLLAMTENLQLPAENVTATWPTHSNHPSAEAVTGSDGRLQQTKFPPVVPGSAPRTGPGQMLQFRGQMLAAEGELGKLRERLKEHDGATPTKKLDPQSVVPSRWANRHPDSFQTAEFARLKHDIELAGGNVQSISVRVLADQPGRYEILFGHRRHRACSELGLPVLATIESAAVSDLDLFSVMDRENRERADLSPYEQGMMYRRALDEKLYPSNRRLAEALGVSHTWVANVLQVADLPAPVIECFRSPLEVQHRHAKAISAAFEKDRKVLLRRAEKLRLHVRNLVPAAVVAALVGLSDADDARRPSPLEVGGKHVGAWFKDGAGRLTIQLNAGVVPDASLEAVARAIVEVLAT